ncbi:MAG: cupin domain-containing protein [SAR324 cluster bacterium]|nr:cupin domain-containing protein [SAR324 cluster bacterium]
MKISLSEFQNRLPLPANEKWPDGVWDTKAFAYGSMSLVLFTPRKKDYQISHDQDELYIVLQGKGEFVVEEDRFSFEAGEALFVAANQRHRFENFSNDLVTWAIFWGPERVE